MRLLVRSIWFLLLSIAACAPQALPDDPDLAVDDIVGGSRDRGRHPAVVALLLPNGLCSGTLVGPRAVLTARHCVSDTVSTLQCPSRYPQVLRDHDPRRISVTNAEDARDPLPYARGVELVLPDTDVLCGADLAVLLLDRSLPGAAPLRLGAITLPDERDRLTVVGYGRRGDSARAGVGERFLRSRVPVLHATAQEFLLGTSGCEGDSGGPAIDERSGRVVGVLSRGGERCNTPTSVLVFTRAGVASQLLEEARRRRAWSDR